LTVLTIAEHIWRFEHRGGSTAARGAETRTRSIREVTDPLTVGGEAWQDRLGARALLHDPVNAPVDAELRAFVTAELGDDDLLVRLDEERDAPAITSGRADDP
jgi:hypothetical protein